VARLVGAAKPTVGGWETKGLRPAPQFLPKVAGFLGYVPAAAASPSDLVQRLTALRRRLRLARSEVADILGLSYATLWAWETGRRQPRGRSLVVLMDFLAAHESTEAEGP